MGIQSDTAPGSTTMILGALVVALILGSSLAAPRNQFDENTSFGEVLQQVSDDTAKVFKTKGKLIELGLKSTADAAIKAYRTVDDSFLNELEESLIKKKRNLIKGVFDVKRGALRTISGIWTSSINGVHDAAAAVQNGIESVTSALSLSNIQGVISNTTSSITTGVSDVGNSILGTIVEKKQNLNDALENFDSQEMFHQGAEKINSAVNVKHKGLEYIGKKLGLFEAADNIAKFKAALPNQ